MRRVITTSCRTHNYAVSEKNSYPLLGRSLNFLGRQWSKKGKILEASMDINYNLIREGVQKQKKPSLGKVRILFLELHSKSWMTAMLLLKRESQFLFCETRFDRFLSLSLCN